MCKVHSTLRDATAPYTKRYQQAKKKANRIFYTFIFCQRSTPTQKNKRVKFPTQKLCNSK